MVKNRIKTLELNHSDFALSTDFYELTMAAAYFKSKSYEKRGVFELCTKITKE